MSMTHTLIGTFLPLLGFALATSASPGPVNAIAAMAGARYGIAVGVGYALGAAAGFTALLLLTGIGFGGAVADYPLLTRSMTMLGGAYMLYLAGRIALAPADLSSERLSQAPGILAGAVGQWLNPKAWIVSLSAISLFVAPHSNYASVLALFCATYFVVCFFSVAIWACLGRFASRLTGSIGLFNKLMALLIVVSIVYLAVDFGIRS
ncbi:MAG: LysE family transporter [Acidihalobacter sp.]